MEGVAFQIVKLSDCILMISGMKAKLAQNYLVDMYGWGKLGNHNQDTIRNSSFIDTFPRLIITI